MQPSAIRFFLTILQWVLYTNVYIALCAVVMILTTAQIFDFEISTPYLLFVFAGTLGSYCLHWYLTNVTHSERGRWNQRHKRILLGLCLGAVLVGIGLLFKLERYDWELLPVVVVTFLYTAPKIDRKPFRALRRIAVLKTAYLALVWTYVTAGLPLLMNPTGLKLDPVGVGAWLLNRFLLIYGIAFWFDYRDRVDDQQSKWLTIVSMISEKQAAVFFRSILLFFGLTVLLLGSRGFDARTLFCLSVPMILLALTARRVVAAGSEYGYYLYLDSLLMASGILLLLVNA